MLVVAVAAAACVSHRNYDRRERATYNERALYVLFLLNDYQHMKRGSSRSLTLIHCWPELHVPAASYAVMMMMMILVALLLIYSLFGIAVYVH